MRRTLLPTCATNTQAVISEWTLRWVGLHTVQTLGVEPASSSRDLIVSKTSIHETKFTLRMRRSLLPTCATYIQAALSEWTPRWVGRSTVQTYASSPRSVLETSSFRRVIHNSTQVWGLLSRCQRLTPHRLLNAVVAPKVDTLASKSP